jgi:hypothetical protein
VQSNQYPRALDLARLFRAAGLPVVIGGFHVSGCISMLPELPAGLQAALDMGVTLFAGEGEGRMADLVRDIAAGTQQPLYNFLSDLPGLEEATIPFLPSPVIKRHRRTLHELRCRARLPLPVLVLHHHQRAGPQVALPLADDIEQIVRSNVAQGITRFFVTDDNFARNRNWEPIFDRLIELREGEKLPIKLFLRSTRCATAFPASSRRRRARLHLGVHRAREHQPRIADGRQEAQNKIWEYRDMLLEWRKQKVLTYAATSWASRPTRRRPSRATSRSSRRSCRSTCWSSPAYPPAGSEDHKSCT